MSAKYPIISVTGSSGAGTTSVRRTFEQIFRRERIEAAYIEGDAFNRYDRAEMSTVMVQEESKGNRNFSDFFNVPAPADRRATLGQASS